MEKIKLYDYQLEGSLFLQLHTHCLLSDGMGLGKTIQAIDAIKELNLGRILIVCPAVAKHNWQNELEKFGLYGAIAGSGYPKADEPIVICSFEYAAKFSELYASTKRDVIIIDEAHFLKEPSSQRTKAILGAKGLVHSTKRLWAMTGTPVCNHAGELWVWLYTFGKTKLSYEGFIARYCKAHHVGNYHSRVQIEGTRTEHAPELKAMLKTCSLRRLKKDVLDLPPVFHSTFYIEGTKDSELFKRFPGLQEQLEEELEILKEKLGVDLDSENFLSVLSFLAQSLSSLRRYHGLKKVLETAKLIKSEMEQGQYKKVVVFGIHKTVLKILEEELSEFNPVKIVGGVSDSDRADAVYRFQNDDSCGVFLGNIKAAGTAITLTESSEMIFIEQDWVPGNNAQAVDRCNRIGQVNSVNCRHIAIKDSLDAKVTATVQRKIQEISTFI